jgi:vacuolar-type H+-ATPase subunit F/Vma7
MAAIVVIGDEPTCAGFRLAGVDAHAPAPAELAAAFERALAGARLVVLTRDCAAALAPETLRAAMAREAPLVVVMPALADPRPDAGFATRIRAVLGIET